MVKLRGAQIAFKNIMFDEQEQPQQLSGSKHFGRSHELNRRRNECLVERYYFIARRNGIDFSYEKNVRDVAAEFFLSPFHTSKIILGHAHQLTSLKMRWKNEPLAKLQKHLAVRWPHLVWT